MLLPVSFFSNFCTLTPLHCPGAADICERLDSLESKVGQGFEAVIATITNAQATQTARDFKAKVRLVTLVYDDLVEDITEAAEAKDRHFPSLANELAKSNAEKAEMRADELYAWAEGFVPDMRGEQGSGQANMSKQDKLGSMPYIVAMAYAMRVKTDARLIRSHSIVDGAERTRFLERSRSSLGVFMRKLRSIVLAIISNTSLLEIALDYHLILATYVMLIASMPMSLRSTVEPCKGPRAKVEIWDDGLGKIR